MDTEQVRVAPERSGTAGIPRPPGDVILETRGLRKAYGPDVVFSGVDLRWLRGERVALLGREGAGKTTLLRLMLGAIGNFDGELRVLGRVPSALSALARLRIAYAPEASPFAPNNGVHDSLDSFRAYYKSWDAELESRLCGPFGLAEGSRCGDAGGALGARVSLVAALCSGAEVLLLDDPESYLDGEGRRAFAAELEGCLKSSSVLLATGDPRGAAAGLDRAWILHRSRILADAPIDELARDMARIEISLEQYARVSATAARAGLVMSATRGMSKTLVLRNVDGAVQAELRSTLGEDPGLERLDLSEAYEAFLDLSSTGTGTAD